MNKKNTLRQNIRARRRSLNAYQHIQAARQFAVKTQHSAWFTRAQKIAFYLPHDGEISPTHLIAVALRKNKQCFLPCVEQGNKMSFRRFRHARELTKNRFGILEPNKRCEKISVPALDVLIMPLVGFDRQGNRLGMGAGFYDRALSFKKAKVYGKPYVIGAAHTVQEVEHIDADPWDIPMNLVVTERLKIKISV